MPAMSGSAGIGSLEMVQLRVEPRLPMVFYRSSEIYMAI